MKRLSISILLFLSFYYSFCQDSKVLTPLIKEIKQSVVPVICHDKTWQKDQFALGSGVVLGDLEKLVILTCEHVIAIKDTNNRTIRYVSNIYINVNDKIDSIVTSVKVDILYANEKTDFALLKISAKNKNLNTAYFKMIQPRLWQRSDDLSEGESVLYIGYPLLLGINEINYPISRTGMICQIQHNRNSFLIDGFVQHGHSGSPVFLLRPIPENFPEQWSFSLIGIATSFPSEYNAILEKVDLRENSKTYSISNPGFTYVTSMNEIINVLNEYGFK